MDVETLKFPIEPIVERFDGSLVAIPWKDYCKTFRLSDWQCPRCRGRILHLDTDISLGPRYLCPDCGPVDHLDVMAHGIRAPHQLKPALLPSDAFNIEDRGAIVLYQLRNPFRFNLPFPPGAWLGRLIGWFFGTIARVWTLQVSCIKLSIW